MFRGYFDLPVSGGRFWVPSVDIHETGENILVKCEIAGVKAEDLQVSLSGDDKVLTIAGIRKELQEERSGRLRCHQLEVYFGPFERSIPLPQQLPIDRERLSAVYKDGFLIVTLPKLPVIENAAPRQIPIAAGEDVVDDVQVEES